MDEIPDTADVKVDVKVATADVDDSIVPAAAAVDIVDVLVAALETTEVAFEVIMDATDVEDGVVPEREEACIVVDFTELVAAAADVDLVVPELLDNGAAGKKTMILSYQSALTTSQNDSKKNVKTVKASTMFRNFGDCF